MFHVKLLHQDRSRADEPKTLPLEFQVTSMQLPHRNTPEIPLSLVASSNRSKKKTFSFDLHNSTSPIINFPQPSSLINPRLRRRRTSIRIPSWRPRTRTSRGRARIHVGPTKLITPPPQPITLRALSPRGIFRRSICTLVQRGCRGGGRLLLAAQGVVDVQRVTLRQTGWGRGACRAVGPVGSCLFIGRWGLGVRGVDWAGNPWAAGGYGG